LTDLETMRLCDCILINLDGRTVDEGACFELGYMYSMSKLCIGIKTDSRSLIRGKNNLMIDGALNHIFYDLDSLGIFISTLPK
jgi:nucleoside 2-deoxyribosyltransferase